MEARLRGVDLTTLEHIHSNARAGLFAGHIWNERMIMRDSVELIARSSSAAHPGIDLKKELSTLDEMRDLLMTRFAIRKDKDDQGRSRGLPSRADALRTYLSWVEAARKDLPDDLKQAKELDQMIKDINTAIEQVG